MAEIIKEGKRISYNTIQSRSRVASWNQKLSPSNFYRSSNFSAGTKVLINYRQRASEATYGLVCGSPLSFTTLSSEKVYGNKNDKAYRLYLSTRYYGGSDMRVMIVTGSLGDFLGEAYN